MSHGQRSLADYSLWNHKESDTTEQLTHTHTHSTCQKIWKTQQWSQEWKRSAFISILKNSNTKECSNYCIIVCISHASKVMLKILQARLQQYVNQELPDAQAGFLRGRRTTDQIAFIGLEKAGEFRKTFTSASLTILQALMVLITTNCGIFLKRQGYQTTLPVSCETCM